MSDIRSELSAFREEDAASLVERETGLILSRCRRQETPRAILLAGQPGAGKTELSTMLISQFGGDAAFINGDDYRRYHPNYHRLYTQYGSDSVSMTSAFSSAVTERLIRNLSDSGVNLVVEGTGRTVEVPQSTAESLTAKGYTVEMAVIAARPEVSLSSTLRRFYQMNERGTIPRATALAAHDLVLEALPANLDTLLSLSCVSRICIWDRDLRQLFGSRVSSSRPSDVLRNYWSRPWTEHEVRDIQRQIEWLRRQEEISGLGQAVTLDLLAQRVQTAVQADRPHPGQTAAIPPP